MWKSVEREHLSLLLRMKGFFKTGRMQNVTLSCLRRAGNSMFVRRRIVGNTEWASDLRRFLADCSKITSERVLQQAHVSIQESGTKVILFKWWALDQDAELTAEKVWRCEEIHDFTSTGNLLLETKVDIKNITKVLQKLTVVIAQDDEY